MIKYLILQTIVLAVASGFIIYENSYYKGKTGHWIDHTALLRDIGAFIMLIFIADAFSFLFLYGTNYE